MKLKTLSVTVAFACFATAICCAESNSAAWMGTWKLNESKSKLAGPGKNNTVVYAQAGDSIKVTVEGVDANGKPMHTEWTGKFDGKDYPVTGDTHDMRSYKQVSDHELQLTMKKDDKVVANGTIVVSADGKSRTVTMSGKDSSGKEMTSVAVYDKS